MIFDNIKYIESYSGLGSNFETAIRFLNEHNLKEIAVGKFDIDEKKVFAIVSEKELVTIPEHWEVHRQYADIHFIIKGHEVIGYCPIDPVIDKVNFSLDSDNCLLTDVNGFNLEMEQNNFAIFLPQDVHRPNCPSSRGHICKKLTVKILLQ